MRHHYLALRQVYHKFLGCKVEKQLSKTEMLAKIAVWKFMLKLNKFWVSLTEEMIRPRSLKTSWLAVISTVILVLTGQLTQNLSTPTNAHIPQVLFSPFSAQSHLLLARDLLTQGNYKEVISEIELAREVVQNNHTGVLGAQSDLERLESEIQTVLHQPGSDIAFWQDLQNKFPDYQPALLNLAILYYNQGINSQSRSYLTTLLNRYPDMRFVLPAELKDLL